jgi:geranylgeranyl reductase family protein
MDAQILIVGAGPAGASAAVALAQQNIKKVLLVDRDRFPRDKTCGSGLSPAALQLAARLGIDGELQARANPILTVRFVTPGGEELRVPAHSAAAILLRRDFDNLLVERARSLGVEFRDRFRVTELVERDGRAIGVRGTDGKEIRAQYILCADGAHTVFSRDPRPRRHIDTLMGWWEGPNFEPGRLDMVFDRQLAPLYGWLFPETASRVNIGICIDGQDADGRRVRRNLRGTFQSFLDRQYRPLLSGARQVGRWKGHPIVHTTWIANLTRPGVLLVGESARVTHNATGEGISQAMQSGVFAAEAVAQVLRGEATEAEAWRGYVWALRRRFTLGFAAGHLLRGVVDSAMLDRVARVYNNVGFRRAIHRLLGAALTGTTRQEAPPSDATTTMESSSGVEQRLRLG